MLDKFFNLFGLKRDDYYKQSRFYKSYKRGIELSLEWGFAFNICIWAETDVWETSNVSLNLHPFFGKWFIRLPFIVPFKGNDMLNQFGFTFFERTLHLHWNDKTKIFHLPWDWEFIRHTIYDIDENDISDKCKNVYGQELLDLTKAQTFDYNYTLKSGEIQNRKASVFKEEREWRWLISKKLGLPFPRMIRTTIDVHFNDEVGERTGSWKGGCVSCGYDLLPNESIEECLRRMEKERKFK